MKLQSDIENNKKILSTTHEDNSNCKVSISSEVEEVTIHIESIQVAAEKGSIINQSIRADMYIVANSKKCI